MEFVHYGLGNSIHDICVMLFCPVLFLFFPPNIASNIAKYMVQNSLQNILTKSD